MQSADMQRMMTNIERYRTEHDYSQGQFARMIGLSKSSYCKLVSGETNKLSVDTLRRIYEVTGKLCYQLMEIYTDDYLKLGQLISDFRPHEMHYMLQFVQVYKEAKRRAINDN